MMRRNFIILTTVAATIFGTPEETAAQDKVQFGGYARAWQENNNLGQDDTVNTDKFSQGHTLIDLGVNLHPDNNTQIQALFRFRTELGGFFGSSATAELRQLFVKGNIAKIIGYEVGDIYVQMSPYTFYNSDGDTKVNEATIFQDIRRDYAEYDNLNRGNRWWQQGAHVDFGLQFDDMFIETIKFDGLFLRNRPAGGAGIPARFQSGGRIAIEQSKNFTLTANYINLFDVPATINDSVGMSNPVTSFELDYNRDLSDKLEFILDAEAGMSQLVYQNDASAPTDNSGIFFDAAAGTNFKNCGFQAKVGYRYTDPRFYSSAAQTKRINFDPTVSTPEVFTSVANNPFAVRSINIFDITRQASIYNRSITEQLMTYNPRYGVVTPYGVATPNRAGVYLNSTYTDSLEKVDAFLEAAIMSEAIPSNSTVAESYLQIKGGVNLAVNKILSFDRKLELTLGGQYDAASRDDGSASSDFATAILDLGIDFELASKLDLLLGSKMVVSSGFGLISTRDQYNEITASPSTFNIDASETMLGYGLKYNFNKSTYLNVQHNLFSYADNLVSANDYSFNQFLIFFNMNI